MRTSTLFRALFVSMVVVASAACGGGPEESTGSSSAALRSVAGRVPAGAGVSSVVALAAGSSGLKTYSAPVDADGRFRLTLPKNARYVVELMSGDSAIATLRFASAPGGAMTSLLAVARPPSSALRSQHHDEAYGDRDDDIELGDVEVDGDHCSSHDDPLDQVDSDGDGSSDYADNDDDNDGRCDADDDDDDNNGTADCDEEHDDDHDGVSNDVDDDHDGGHHGGGDYDDDHGGGDDDGGGDHDCDGAGGDGAGGDGGAGAGGDGGSAPVPTPQ